MGVIRGVGTLVLLAGILLIALGVIVLLLSLSAGGWTIALGVLALLVLGATGLVLTLVGTGVRFVGGILKGGLLLLVAGALLVFLAFSMASGAGADAPGLGFRDGALTLAGRAFDGGALIALLSGVVLAVAGLVQLFRGRRRG